jgi:carboxyl-terminal processing protease
MSSPRIVASVWRGRRLGLALLALLPAAGCAVGGLTEPESTGHLTRDMFVTAFNDMDAVYIRQPDIEAIAFDSIDELHQLDAKLTTSVAHGALELQVDKAVVASHPYTDDFSPTEWGELTGTVLDEAMAASPILRATASETIFEAMLAPAVKNLDAFSRYAGADAAAENRASRDGFGGIGVRISVEDDVVRITSVMHYTPAERMGLKRDDVIVAIDGIPTKGLSQQDVVDRLRGPVDSNVSVRLQRSDRKDVLTVTLTRAHVVPETVTYRRDGNIAYFRIYGFNSETTDSFKRAFANSKTEIGAKLSGIILDLRENPGGLLNQSVSIANLFLSEGRIVSTHGRHPESHQFFDASGGDEANGLPIVVLVDGNSASAAEIVAAALQDNGRAVLVGSNSYGKGTVQTVLPLPNKGEITLTWARFHAPSGYTLHGLGVLPNVCTVNRKTAEQVIAELDSGEMPSVPVEARNAAGPDDDAAHQRLRKTCPARTDENPIDLEVARHLLERPVLFNAALYLAGPFDAGLAQAFMDPMLDPATVQ